jgi:hypothetical protein
MITFPIHPICNLTSSRVLSALGIKVLSHATNYSLLQRSSSQLRARASKWSRGNLGADQSRCHGSGKSLRLEPDESKFHGAINRASRTKKR